MDPFTTCADIRRLGVRGGSSGDRAYGLYRHLGFEEVGGQTLSAGLTAVVATFLDPDAALQLVMSKAVSRGRDDEDMLSTEQMFAMD